jgi:transcription elongation GreA/GreB family factor
MSTLNPEISKLVANGKLQGILAPRLAVLPVGTYCFHKSWGVGRIADWKLDEDQIIVDFEDKKGHPLKVEFAAKSLDPVADTHILARRHADPASLQKLAKEDKPALVRAVLESHKGSMSLDVFETVVKPKIVSEGAFKGWWESCKKELRSRPEFIVPAKRNLPLELRGGDLSPTDALISDFRKARDLKGKGKALDAITRELEIFQDQAVLEAIIKEADDAATQNLRLRPVEALDLILSRDELRDKVKALHDNVSPALAKAIAAEGPRLAECVGSLAVSRQRRVFDALVDATGDAGVESLLPLINRLSQRSLGEIVSVLTEKGYSGPMNKFFQTGITQRSLSSEVLVWLGKERKGAGKAVFSLELSKAMLSAIERDHFDEANRKANRINDFLQSDKDVIKDFLALGEVAQARNFARQVMLSPGMEEMGKRSLLARFIRIYPDLEDIITESSSDKQEEQEETLLVSWTSLTEKRKTYEHLIQVEIPKNIEDISIAREYGDLRENFEFKSAKEYSLVLSRRRFDIERDLNRAKGTDFSDASDTMVSVGSVVTYIDTETNKEETFSILGAWDTKIEENIISYLSVSAQALLNHSVGDAVDLPSEDSAITRHVKIVKLGKVDPKPYEAQS